MSLECATKLLASYSGRDKVLRTLGYTSLFLSGAIKDKNTAESFRILSSKLSGCRAVLRLFDDLPMLSCTLSYGFGKHEPDKLLRLLNLLTNAVDQGFYPIEHIAWAAENNIISLKNADSWSLANSFCWVISLYLTLLSCIRKLGLLHSQRQQCPTDLVRQASLKAEQQAQFLLALQSMLDLGHAVHWLPKGFLWGGTMQPWQRGLLGTLSSFISFYRAIKAMRQ